MAEDRDHNLAGLSLEDKVSLLSGASLWRTPALDSKGFRALKMSDELTACEAMGPWGHALPLWLRARFDLGSGAA